MTYNAAADLIERNLAAGRGPKTAFIDDRGHYNYADLAERAGRFAHAVRRLGIEPEQRILLCLHDGIDFPTAFLGAIKAGIVPVAVNTLLSAARIRLYAGRQPGARGPRVGAGSGRRCERLWHCGPIRSPRSSSRAPIGGSGRSPNCLPACTRRRRNRADPSRRALLLALFVGLDRPAQRDRPCSYEPDRRPPSATRSRCSASTRERHRVFGGQAVFRLRARQCADLSDGGRRDRRILSAERPTPARVARVLRRHRPTIFCGVPTLYNAMLASPDLPQPDDRAAPLRVGGRAVAGRRSAGAGSQRIGVDILDGIGSTEMLHIFLSNRPGDVRYGTTGKPVPGYALQDRRRARSAGAARRDRRPPGQRPDRRRSLLEQPRAQPRRRFSANGRAPATNTSKTRTATTSIAGAATT